MKLAENREFRKLILEEFMVSEAARLVGESADPVMTPQQRADALAMAQAAGHLKRYLSMIVQLANNAENAMGDLESELESARAEELADETDEETVGGLG